MCPEKTLHLGHMSLSSFAFLHYPNFLLLLLKTNDKSGAPDAQTNPQGSGEINERKERTNVDIERSDANYHIGSVAE